MKCKTHQERAAEIEKLGTNKSLELSAIVIKNALTINETIPLDLEVYPTYRNSIQFEKLNKGWYTEVEVFEKKIVTTSLDKDGEVVSKETKKI